MVWFNRFNVEGVFPTIDFKINTKQSGYGRLVTRHRFAVLRKADEADKERNSSLTSKTSSQAHSSAC